MCAILQLVSAPLNPIPIAEHFRRSHPQCEHSCEQHRLALVGIFEGASFFLCDVISQWLGLLDTGSNSSPEVHESLCISCSDV